MTVHIPPPASVTWTFPAALRSGTANYPTCTLRAPTGAEMLKSMAAGGSDYERALRLFSSVSAEEVPFEALILAPDYQLQQMASYLQAWDDMPLPGPLADWHAAQAEEAAAPAATATGK